MDPGEKLGAGELCYGCGHEDAARVDSERGKTREPGGGGDSRARDGSRTWLVRDEVDTRAGFMWLW